MLPVAQKIFSYSFLMLLAMVNKSLDFVLVDGLLLVIIVSASSSSNELLVDMKGLVILPNNSVNPNNPFVAKSPPN